MMTLELHNVDYWWLTDWQTDCELAAEADAWSSSTSTSTHGPASQHQSAVHSTLAAQANTVNYKD